jgi:hypothetical protein
MSIYSSSSNRFNRPHKENLWQQSVDFGMAEVNYVE